MIHRPRPASASAGQESVWDYPRPPRVEPSPDHVVVTFADRVVADTTRAVRVLETSHPPVYYVPRDDVATVYLTPNEQATWCEFKGRAVYGDLVVGTRRSASAFWWYPDPRPAYRMLADMVAFYPGRVDRCLVGDEVVRPQNGDFYGGWVTSRIVGPFKGGPGTLGW